MKLGEDQFDQIGEDEPDVFYDCFDEDYDESLQSVANNFYGHVTGDHCCLTDHDQCHDSYSGQFCHDFQLTYKVMKTQFFTPLFFLP